MVSFFFETVVFIGASRLWVFHIFLVLPLLFRAFGLYAQYLQPYSQAFYIYIFLIIIPPLNQLQAVATGHLGRSRSFCPETSVGANMKEMFFEPSTRRVNKKRDLKII